MYVKRYPTYALVPNAILTVAVLVDTSLRPEGAENMSLGSQVSDLCFWNPNCIRNPKIGSKQSITRPTK